MVKRENAMHNILIRRILKRFHASFLFQKKNKKKTCEL